MRAPHCHGFLQWNEPVVMVLKSENSWPIAGLYAFAPTGYHGEVNGISLLSWLCAVKTVYCRALYIYTNPLLWRSTSAVKQLVVKNVQWKDPVRASQ